VVEFRVMGKSEHESHCWFDQADEYYIPTRYPNGLPGTSRPHEFYDEEESSECLQLAELVLTAIDAILGS